MRATLNLDATATRRMENAPKVRVKVENGVLMFKPTDRKYGKALPRGEKLVTLSKRNPNRAFSLVKFGLRGEIADCLAVGTYTIVPGARGYFTLSAASSDGAALVKVIKG